MRAESACTLQNLQGRYVPIFAGEFSGFWQRCNVSVNASGLATGGCLESTGNTGPLDPIQFSVRSNYSVSGETASGFCRVSLRAEPRKRGPIGRFVFDNGVDNFLEGPVVAVKRGKCLAARRPGEGKEQPIKAAV